MRTPLLPVFALAFALSTPVAQAQITNVTNSTSTPTPVVGHDYINLLGETVNPQNGSLSVRVAVPTPLGRGLTLPFAFTYDSNSAGLRPKQGQPNQLQWQFSIGVFATGPWSYSLPQLTAILQDYQDPGAQGSPNPCVSTTGYVFQDPTGGRHALALSAVLSPHGSNPGAIESCSVTPGGPWSNFFSGGDDFYRAQINNINPQGGGSTGTAGAGQVQLADASGTVYSFNSTNVSGWSCNGSGAGVIPGTTIIPNPQGYAMPNTIEDRNGNLITISDPCAEQNSSSISDTTGRTALSFQVTGSIGSRQITSVTVPGLAQPYSATLGSGTGTTVNVNATQVAVIATPNNCTGVPAWQAPGVGSSTSNWISTITLPNGKQYQFTYDPTYGLLSKITYPGGGYVSYTWGMNPQSALAKYTDTQAKVFNDCIYRYDKPAVLHRYVSFDGQNIALQQDFSYSTTWGGAQYEWSGTQTTITTHDLVRGTSFQTVYTYLPTPGLVTPNTIGFSADSQLPVESTVTYKDVSGATLRTITKTWGDSFEMGSELQTLDNGAMSSVCYSYGPGHTITDKKEYDFGQITSSSTPCPTTTPARETATTYKAFANPSIFDRPSSVITYDNGTRIAETDYTYDQSQSSCSGYSTCPVSPAPTAHDETNYAASSTAPRGNPTATTSQCFQGTQACASGNLTTTSVFDETGQTTSMTDPNGHTTQYSYVDSYTVLSNGTNVAYTPTASTNAYLTKIKNPLSQTQNFTYDFNNAQLTISKDQNNLATTYLYNDSLARPTLTTRPDNGATTVAYNDTANTVTISKKINPGQTVTSVTLADGIGHVKQAQLTSDPQGTAYTDTAYDGLGRVYTVSNPYRTGSDPTTTSGTTTYFYDALGRKCLEVPPDGTLPSGGVCPATQPANTIFTTYSGNTTTVTDQTGKSRKSVTDGLGRLTQVFEDPAGLNYETDYRYDALGNLLCAAQKGTASGTFTNCSSIPSGWRPRTFTYDSLSRLLTSNNPEVGTISYKHDSDTNCSGSNTFLGLLVSKTDARSLRTCAQYDAINRETVLNYSNGDPIITTTYDQPTCLSLSTCQNIGYRTSMTDAAGSEAWAYQVDAANNRSVHAEQRTTNSVTKNSKYFLDQAGNVTQAVYPTGRTVNYTFDNADRPSTAADGSNGVTYATDWSTPPSNTNCTATAVCYTPQGAFYALSIGQTSSFTGLNLTHTYNNRLQPSEFKASSPGGNAIDITYSFIDPVSGHNAGHVYGLTNNIDSTRSQTFTYDSLNRITAAQTTSTHATSPSHCWGETYTLDAWGNLNAIAATTNTNYTGCTVESGFSSTADGNNHLPAWAYDASGNALNDGAFAYTWDAESQLKTAGGVTYTYDADGRRVSKSNGKLYWYGSGGDILAETDASGNTTAEYIFFGGKRIAMLPASGNAQYYIEDLLGTSRVVTTNSGTVCYDADFYPFGGERAPYTSNCYVTNNYKFEGKERDAETSTLPGNGNGNDDFGARYYSNRFGRWLSADWSTVPVPVPYANLSNPQTLNLYAMVSDDPESFADLDGHDHLLSPTDAPCTAPSSGGPYACGNTLADLSNTLTADQSKVLNRALADIQQALNNPDINNDLNKHFPVRIADDYAIDTRAHGRPHIDRTDSDGNLVGRYNEDGTPIKFKGKIPPRIPRRDSKKFQKAADKLREYREREAKANAPQGGGQTDPQQQKSPVRLFNFSLCAGPCDPVGSPSFMPLPGMPFPSFAFPSFNFFPEPLPVPI